MRNYKLSNDYFNTSYALRVGRHYGYTDNRARVVAASLVVDKQLTVKEAAYVYSRCENTIRNWVKTLDTNNPRMDG